MHTQPNVPVSSSYVLLIFVPRISLFYEIKSNYSFCKLFPPVPVQNCRYKCKFFLFLWFRTISFTYSNVCRLFQKNINLFNSNHKVLTLMIFPLHAVTYLPSNHQFYTVFHFVGFFI